MCLGNKPDFHQAMKSNLSKDFYHRFIDALRDGYQSEKVHDGRFGEHTRVDLINDGPLTLIFESNRVENGKMEEKKKILSP
jgi:D-tyrosyl-tRNA(Tyr) deacylase